MENKIEEIQEEWLKLDQYGIPEGEFIVTSLNQSAAGLKIVLDDEKYCVEILFDGIPVLFRDAVEGIRMRTWSKAQLKYQDKYYFRRSFFFEVRNSILIEWCIEESCGFYEKQQLKHYCIITSEEVIDIISTFEPTVKVSQI